jgi:hypothetical protein
VLLRVQLFYIRYSLSDQQSAVLIQVVQQYKGKNHCIVRVCLAAFRISTEELPDSRRYHGAAMAESISSQTLTSLPVR